MAMWAGWGLRWVRVRGTRRASKGSIPKDGAKLKNKRWLPKILGVRKK